jgi:hypothetical protein
MDHVPIERVTNGIANIERPLTIDTSLATNIEKPTQRKIGQKSFRWQCPATHEIQTLSAPRQLGHVFQKGCNAISPQMLAPLFSLGTMFARDTDLSGSDSELLIIFVKPHSSESAWETPGPSDGNDACTSSLEHPAHNRP